MNKKIKQKNNTNGYNNCVKYFYRFEAYNYGPQRWIFDWKSTECKSAPCSLKEMTSPTKNSFPFPLFSSRLSVSFFFCPLLCFFFLKLQLSLPSRTLPEPKKPHFHRNPTPFISFPPHMLPHSPLTHKTIKLHSTPLTPPSCSTIQFVPHYQF